MQAIFGFFLEYLVDLSLFVLTRKKNLYGQLTPQYINRMTSYHNFNTKTCVILLMDTKEMPGLNPTVEQYLRAFAYNPINIKGSIDVESMPILENLKKRNKI